MRRILIIDDDISMRQLLEDFFKKNSYHPMIAPNGKTGIGLLKQKIIDLVVCDFNLPDYNGIEILQKIKIINPEIQVIMIAEYSDVRIAVESIKKGAFDYVTKPLYPDDILVSVQNACKKLDNMRSNTVRSRKIKSEVSQKNDYVIGDSYQSQLVQKHIELIGPTDMSVIIIGDSGTGKEYVAREIHRKSNRFSEPFVAIDCGALSDSIAGSELFGHVKGAFTGAINNKRGCFEIANGGTLFLDEIGNLSYENQTKLLRVLQERKVKRLGSESSRRVDVRLLVATNEDLRAEVNAGNFREDIYHRLNEFRIELAPLRERPEDIRLFSFHFLKSANQQLNKSIKGFEEEVMKIFMKYYWHGNLRELRNVIKRAVLLSQQKHITLKNLPPELSNKRNIDNDIVLSVTGEIPSLKDAVNEAEKKIIKEVLKKLNNNKTSVAKALKIDRKTLYNKLKEHNIKL